jgi:hypothetical protein
MVEAAVKASLEEGGVAVVATASTATEPIASHTRPRARFVQDVTIADGTIVEAGQRFSKTWRIRNGARSAIGYVARVISP